MSLALFNRNLARCGKQVTIQNRAITAPIFGATDFDETFTDTGTVGAIVKTISGKTFFDGVGTESLKTHEIRIAYQEGVTAESWVLFNGRRLDILQVENCCENDQVLILTCNDRGTTEASKA